MKCSNSSVAHCYVRSFSCICSTSIVWWLIWTYANGTLHRLCNFEMIQDNTLYLLCSKLMDSGSSHWIKIHILSITMLKGSNIYILICKASKHKHWKWEFDIRISSSRFILYHQIRLLSKLGLLVEYELHSFSFLKQLHRCYRILIRVNMKPLPGLYGPRSFNSV